MSSFLPPQQYDKFRVGGAPPPANPNQGPRATATGYSGPGSRYGAPGEGGFTWDANADNRFGAENPIDQSTGLPSGPGAYGLIPNNLALQYQAAHDRKIWEMRQRMMRGGLNYGRGALNLLQSFRQGGGAAIEAGIYNNLMGAKFNQAQLTQPLDLLGDYRREEASRARMRANRASERQLAVQIGGTLATTAAIIGTGGAAAGILPALTAGLNAYTASQQGRPQAQPQKGEGSMAQQQGYQTGGMGVMQAGEYGIPIANDQGIVPSTGGAPGAYGPPVPGGGAAQAGIQPDQPQGMQDGQDTPQGGAPGQQQGGAGGGPMGMGAPTVGSDGIFTPTAYAASGAQQAQHPIQDVILMKQMADTIDADPFWDAFDMTVNARFADRMAGSTMSYSGDAY